MRLARRLVLRLARRRRRCGRLRLRRIRGGLRTGVIRGLCACEARDHLFESKLELTGSHVLRAVGLALFEERLVTLELAFQERALLLDLTKLREEVFILRTEARELCVLRFARLAVSAHLASIRMLGSHARGRGRKLAQAARAIARARRNSVSSSPSSNATSSSRRTTTCFAVAGIAVGMR